MSICWYCHWGWPAQVVEIYERWYPIAGEAGLNFGPGHIVWSDENFETESIELCLTQPQLDLSDLEYEAALASLRELLEVPESVRCCEPEDYDDEHPALFPPPAGLVMAKKPY